MHIHITSIIYLDALYIQNSKIWEYTTFHGLRDGDKYVLKHLRVIYIRQSFARITTELKDQPLKSMKISRGLGGYFVLCRLLNKLLRKWLIAETLPRKQVWFLYIFITWWRHQMEAFSALLVLCAGNSPVTVNSPQKGQWRGALMFSLICTLNK